MSLAESKLTILFTPYPNKLLKLLSFFTFFDRLKRPAAYSQRFKVQSSSRKKVQSSRLVKAKVQSLEFKV